MNICVYCGTVHPPTEGQWRTQWACVGAVERRNGDFKYFQVFCNLICSKCSVINLKIMSKAHISLGLQRERAPRSEFIPSCLCVPLAGRDTPVPCWCWPLSHRRCPGSRHPQGMEPDGTSSAHPECSGRQGPSWG